MQLPSFPSSPGLKNPFAKKAPAATVADGPGAKVLTGDAPAAGDRLGQVRLRHQADDFEGALELLLSFPQESPDRLEADKLLAWTKEQLLVRCEERLGPLTQSPRVLLHSDGSLLGMKLDHRTGYVLSRVDGAATYEDLIMLSGMTRLDALRSLCALLDANAIGV
jgi:hypothetical protein